MPRFIQCADSEEVSRRMAEILAGEIRKRPGMLLCASAGSSPRRTYRLLGELAAADLGAFSQFRVIKIDEWGGLPGGSPATCEADLQENLLLPLRVSPGRYQGFNSDPADPAAECRRIAAWLSQHGPIDLSILGIGANGHIAMIEPADEFLPAAHIAKLAESSLRHPMLAAAGKLPTYGLTLGIREILDSKKIVLLATGESKRGVLSRLKTPSITTHFPASFLFLHPDVTVLHDQAAAGT